MRRSTAERLTRIYPRAWRDRFGDEFIDLLETQPFGAAVLWDVTVSAAVERGRALISAQTCMAYASNVGVLARRPSGFVPILCSLAALAIVLIALASSAGARRPDEGAAAHVFQLLIAAQMPMLAFFALRWARKARWAALTVLSAQALAIALALAPVWYFHL